MIPVAILSSATFDATQVAPTTVALGALTVGVRGKSGNLLAHSEDVDGDGVIDLVVQIEDVDGEFAPGATDATLTGQTFGGLAIQGNDGICIVP